MHNTAANLPAKLEDDLASLIAERFFDISCPVDAQTDLFSAGLDSMGIMQLVVIVEEKWNVALESGDLTRENFSTPRNLAALMRRRSAPAQ